MTKTALRGNVKQEKAVLPTVGFSVSQSNNCASDKIEKNEMGVHRVLVGKPERERDHWEYPILDGRIILRWIFRKWDVGAWTGFCWLRIETGGGHL
jgi:hypothetical protein